MMYSNSDAILVTFDGHQYRYTEYTDIQRKEKHARIGKELLETGKISNLL